jgi:hypothetical protein
VLGTRRRRDLCLRNDHAVQAAILTLRAQNTTQKSISIAFCVSYIRHDLSLSKYRKQKQSPPGNTKNGARPGGDSSVDGTCMLSDES